MHRHDTKKDYDLRLAAIEGHIKGIRKMVEEDKDCASIMMQLSAINGAVKNLNKIILKEHLNTCVKQSIEQGSTEKLNELNIILDTYV